MFAFQKIPKIRIKQFLLAIPKLKCIILDDNGLVAYKSGGGTFPENEPMVGDSEKMTIFIDYSESVKMMNNVGFVGFYSLLCVSICFFSVCMIAYDCGIDISEHYDNLKHEYFSVRLPTIMNSLDKDENVKQLGNMLLHAQPPSNKDSVMVVHAEGNIDHESGLGIMSGPGKNDLVDYTDSIVGGEYRFN